MRTVIELPDELAARAKHATALDGLSLGQLAPEKRKVRKDPPAIGDKNSAHMAILSRKQIDEAIFGCR
jgi:hypothetical protein